MAISISSSDNPVFRIIRVRIIGGLLYFILSSEAVSDSRSRRSSGLPAFEKRKDFTLDLHGFFFPAVLCCYGVLLCGFSV